MRKRAPGRLPRQLPPDQAEREYYRALSIYAKAYCDLLRGKLEDLIPKLKDEAGDELPDPRQDAARFDANVERALRLAFDWVQGKIDERFSDKVLQRWARNMVGRVNKRAKDNTQKVAKAIDVEAEPLMRDKELSPYFQNVVDENVGLIRSITKGKEELFKNQLVAMITQDAPQDQIREMIAKYLSPKTGSVMNRAALIARDQVGKLNGALNQYRQRQLGGTRYRWRGSKDSRERPDHLRLEGKVFSWDKPPIVDRGTGRRAHPGEDFQCRCHAEMVVEDLIDDL